MGKYVWTAAGGVLLLSLLAGAVWLVQAEEPYAPDQPIAFDHKVHVTDYNNPVLLLSLLRRSIPFRGSSLG